MNKTIKIILACTTLPLSLQACGEATSADAEAMPDDLAAVKEIERDLPTPDTEAPIVGEVDSACRANLAQPYIDQTMDLETRSALLDAVEPQAIIRFLGPDEETGDSDDPDRLNIRTDADDVITEVFCG